MKYSLLLRVCPLLFMCVAAFGAAALPTSIAAPVVLELAPGTGNPRNSEGAFLELKDGKILFVYSHFFGESFSGLHL